MHTLYVFNKDMQHTVRTFKHLITACMWRHMHSDRA